MKTKLLFLMSHRLLGATLWKFIYNPAFRLGIKYSFDEMFDMYTIEIHLLMIDIKVIVYK
tara:strand:- start:260 stop:439 length:180 start_codon:yes stop_codon:yes gene_type:complete